MIVCVCKAVRSDVVEATIAAGAGTVDDVALRCGAGSRCGGCRPTVEALLESGVPRRERHRAEPAA